MPRNGPGMTEPAAESHDSLDDDSWFDRPGRPAGRRAITRGEVLAALERAGLEPDPPAAVSAGPGWDGLDDSWFDRPPRPRRR